MFAIALNIILHYRLLSISLYLKSLLSILSITRLISQLNGIKLEIPSQDTYPIILHSKLYFSRKKIVFIVPISGGFRNKINGSLYHHASTQTPTIKKDLKDFSNLRTRETQTFETRTLSVQSYREAGLEFGFVMLLLVVIPSRSSRSLSLYFSLT